MFSKLITVEPLDFADPPLEADPFEGTEGPDEEPNQTLRARDGASFSGIIRQISQAHWRAYAWIRLESLQRTLEQRIGPMNFATLPLAHQWLRRAGGKRGFSSFEILVQPAGAQGVSKSIRVDGEAAVPIVRVLPTSTLNEVPPANDPGEPYRFGSGIVKAPTS
jgi:hypothetical protein